MQDTLTRPVAEDFTFTTNWFQVVAKNAWDALIPEVKPKKVLEIGSFEGASTCYLIATCADADEMEIHCVDTWEGGEEHKSDGIDMAKVEARFKHNTALAKQRSGGKISVVPHKGFSALRLADLISLYGPNYFDLIYVDGSHQAPDVLTDAVLGFTLLKVGGTMIFDDYLWGQGGEPLHTPKPAIDAFMNIYFQKMVVLRMCSDGKVGRFLPLYQLYTRKTAN